eukprot:TRINITY_DN5961_c0_g1_i1.p1 TRINITY_DN5961_c0_g1~~TRINITY_DN5961_c0_g1_i1.p1  ORF type:complete len:159 (+),score=40.08 TRINITY_DN5961_c0_g1_i1:54-479(+)
MSASLALPRISSAHTKFSSCNSVFFNNGNGRREFVKKKKNSIVGLNRGQKGLNCRCMFGLGMPELVVIAGVAILVFGPKKLPEVGRSIGKTVKSFQQAAKEFETELRKPEATTESPTEEETTAVSKDEKKDLEVSGAKESL